MNPSGQYRNEDDCRNQQFLLLLGRHELQLTACVHAMIPSWHDAEDILQETKIQLWREFDKFEQGSDFAAWARTVARYVVRTHLKQKRRLRQFDGDVAEAIIAQMAKTPAENDRRLAILAGCVRKLGDDALELLRRCYIDRQKIKDIAESLNRSLTGTYSALSRMRRDLLECVQENLHREDRS